MNISIRSRLNELSEVIRDVQKRVDQMVDGADKTEDFGINAVDATKPIDSNMSPIRMRLFPRARAQSDEDDLELDTVVRIVLDADDCLALASWAERATVSLDDDDVACVEVRGSLVINDEHSQRLFEIVRDRHG
jgi:chemotaxis regulatin CheY-phosphate phosphatase CheZ